MAVNQVKSNGFGNHQSAVRAKDLHSQKQHEHGNMRVGLREEGSKQGPQTGNIKGPSKQIQNSAPPQNHRHIKEEGRDRRDHGEFSKHVFKGAKNHERLEHGNHRQLQEYHNHGKHVHDKHIHLKHMQGRHGYNSPGIHGFSQGIMFSYQSTQITISRPLVFRGSFNSIEDTLKAHSNFAKAALDFIKKPNELSYRSLNDAMMKLMDSKFSPSYVGGNVQVSILNLKHSSMVKFTMDVTPSPVKTLDEAREDLKNAYSTRRDGEKGIADIRKEAYTNYIRALSEKYKGEGKIAHTNNTPTTPVFKSSVIFTARITQVSVTGFREISHPRFENNFIGRLTVKNQSFSLCNDSHKHNSYLNMLKNDSKKSHISHHHRDNDHRGSRHNAIHSKKH